MRLVNKNPITANLAFAEVDGFENRIGYVVAKATFLFDNAGNTTLEKNDPYPIFDKQHETDLGLLPRDNVPKSDNNFEVILLGKAYAPNSREARHLRASLTVGNIKRELLVFGDRLWTTDASGRATISAAQPFTEMPLTYDRAFGGSTDVLIDRDSYITVAEPLNKGGRGFDPSLQARSICEFLRSPDGYPVFEKHRLLPNIESADRLIQNSDDRPVPSYWATVPLDSEIQAMRTIEFADPPKDNLLGYYVSPNYSLQAHPDWVIECPAGGSRIELTNITQSGEDHFTFPDLRVIADYNISSSRGRFELPPQALVILPEEMKFYITYRYTFNTPFIPETNRTIRLRLSH